MGRARHIVTCLLFFAAAGCGGEPAGHFSPLIQPGPDGRYDLMVEGVPDIRDTELAPGASPAVPVIDGDRATKKGHFLATYGGDVDPGEIGEQMFRALRGAPFLVQGETRTVEGEDSLSGTFTYAAQFADGTVALKLARTDQPNRLDVTFEIEERLR